MSDDICLEFAKMLYSSENTRTLNSLGSKLYLLGITSERALNYIREMAGAYIALHSSDHHTQHTP